MPQREKTLVVSRKSLVAREKAVDLMARHGLYGWQFAFNDNVRRAGVCYYPCRNRPGRIELSVHFIERNSEDDVLDTILHEIAHALVGRGHGHDDVWKAKCVEIGAKPERCFGDEIDMPRGKWHASCPNCGRQFHRHRRPKQLHGWHCRPCGRQKGKFSWSHSDGTASAV